MIKLLFIFLLIGIAGCKMAAEKQSQSDNTISLVDAESLSSLDWLESANVNKDIKAARKTKDYRLIVFAGRGETMPGVPVSEWEALKQKCGKRYMPGSTDVIRNDKELELFSKANEYTSAYNQAIMKDCKK